MQDKIEAQMYQTEQEWAEAEGVELVYSRNQPSRDTSMKEDQDNAAAEQPQEQGCPNPREEKKNVFHLDDTKVIPAEYHVMDLNGLLSVSVVDPRFREMIAKHQFF